VIYGSLQSSIWQSELPITGRVIGTFHRQASLRIQGTFQKDQDKPEWFQRIDN
jgi:hypothetical protein